MIVSAFDPKHGQCSLTVESADDLWTLRRLIRKGDVVVTRTSRVMKREEEFSRPDKGERIKLTIALAVEEVHLDSSVERLRLRGSIVEASDDSVARAGSHSVTISPGHPITIRKQNWGPIDRKLIEQRTGVGRFIMVAIDRREAGLGTLSDSHLSVVTTVESGVGGKQGEEQSLKPFVSKVAELIAQISTENDQIVVAGPGNTKSAVLNQLAAQGGALLHAQVVDGFDMSGSDGVRALVKFPAFQEVAKGSTLVEMQRILTEAVKRIASSDPRVAYTLERVRRAADAGAVGSCIVSDNIFSTGIDEQELVNVLNEVEERRGSVFLADSSLELGKQVSALGGVVALLRYGLKA